VARLAVSVVLSAHFPFFKDCSPAEPGGALAGAAREGAAAAAFSGAAGRDGDPGAGGMELESAEESLFFDALSETYLPLLEAFDRLEGERVPFRIGLALSPILGQMLGDRRLMGRYAAHLDRQIAFGAEEAARLGGSGPLAALAGRCLDRAIDRRAQFAARHDGCILSAIGHYRRREKIELLAAPATHAFLPFLCRFPESVQAQVEVGLSFSRHALGSSPRGFWLPGLGWSPELDGILRAYGFGYTIAESHGLVLGSPPPSRGSFFPVRTPHGLLALARDFRASEALARMRREGPYRDNSRDAAHDLPAGRIGPFLAQSGARCSTGHKYWQAPPAGGAAADAAPYDPERAALAAEAHALEFLDGACDRLGEASRRMDGQPLSLCAFDADDFGLRWHEGPRFLESLFRLAQGRPEVEFVAPSDYIARQDPGAIEASLPEFSSWGESGYAERWLGSSSDWIYRHLGRACERMVELAERFPGDSWVRERALNQAARELLIAQSSDWPEMMRRQESSGFARRRAEGALRNFTTIYEAMSSSHISTEWLTGLESRRGVFPDINYRAFRRKS